MRRQKILLFSLVLALFILSFSACGTATSERSLLNVSYDPTRELYTAYNELFLAYWYEQTGETISITQSHGGSGKQALQVANGLEADVVTLALEGDIDSLVTAGLIEDDYIDEFAEDSSPYTSTIVFLVRSGNPKNITDWDDLLAEDIAIITPNPKTSGGARWNYLAAWYYFESRGESEEEIINDMTNLYQNVLVLDSGARGATTTFVENGQGDVLIAWENEPYLALAEYPDEYEIVIPSHSILCQATVAIVDEIVDKNNTRDIATAYLAYLYASEAQELIAQNYYRPLDTDVYTNHTSSESSHSICTIPSDGKWIIDTIDLTSIAHFGGWTSATETHFSDGGLFDLIYES